MNQLSISSYCVIHKNAVKKNGGTLYEQKVKSLESFLLLAYGDFNLSYPKFYKMDNLSKLGWLATEILLKDEQLTERYTSENVGIVLGNSNSSLDTDIHYTKTIEEIPSPALFVYSLPNIVIGEIAIRNGFKGENAFFVSDKFNAELMHQYINILFAENSLQACICGWVDVLGDDYKCVLFLVENSSDNSQLLFTKEALENIFNQDAER